MTSQGRAALLKELRSIAVRAVRAFDLPCFRLAACTHRDRHDCMACCTQGGVIRIKLEHRVTGARLSWASLVDSLLHELAHLEYQDHGARWRALRSGLKAWYRSEAK